MVGKTFPPLPFLDLLQSRPYYLLRPRSWGPQPVRTLTPPFAVQRVPSIVVHRVVGPLLHPVAVYSRLTLIVFVMRVPTLHFVMVTGSSFMGASIEK